MYLPGLFNLPTPMDTKQIVGLLCPTPLFLSHGAKDIIFPIRGVAEIDQVKVRVRVGLGPYSEANRNVSLLARFTPALASPTGSRF